MSNGMMHIVNYMMKISKSIINYKMPYLFIFKNDSIHSKSKASHLSNIWIDRTNYEMNDSHCASPITNIINIEQYDL